MGGGGSTHWHSEVRGGTVRARDGGPGEAPPRRGIHHLHHHYNSRGLRRAHIDPVHTLTLTRSLSPSFPFLSHSHIPSLTRGFGCLTFSYTPPPHSGKVPSWQRPETSLNFSSPRRLLLLHHPHYLLLLSSFYTTTTSSSHPPPPPPPPPPPCPGPLVSV